jgi:nucleoside-diphosphate-sugar epimerase
MNILITGGNGFLGFNLVKKLLTEGHNIYVFSKNSNNLNSVLKNIKFTSASNKDFILYKKDIEDFSPDIVFHFGWSGGNNHKDTNNISQFYDNVSPSIDLINIIGNLSKKPKFIGVGSFAEYGEQENLIDENTFESPLNLYGLSKLTFKKYSETLCNQYGIKWVWIRPCYVYGPGDVSTRLIPTLINKFLNNQLVKLDKCDVIIDYIYIDDFTNFIYFLALSDYTGVYNICSGEEYELKYIISQLHNLANSESDIIFDDINMKSSVSKYICGNNNKIKIATNINCEVDLKNGLIKTINYYKNERSSNINRQ